MGKRRIIVCERTGIWATVLQRHLPGDVRLKQVRGLAECAAGLADAPTSLLAIELSWNNLAALFDLLGQLPQRFPLARAIVLGDSGLADDDLRACEWPLREAGALHFVASPRALGGLRRTVENHFTVLPEVQAGFAENVWNTLPWSDAATA